MPIVLDDANIRASLHTDILSAWSGLTSVNDDPPFLPQSSADLPQAFVQLLAVEPDYTGRQASLGNVTLWHKYKITGLFAWPTTGTLEAAKLAQANLLLSPLTINYAGWKTHVSSIDFNEATTSPGEAGNQEPIFTVEIEFDLEVVSPI